MPIYHLVPTDLENPNWNAATHKGPIVVRAADEKSARNRAKMAFSLAMQEMSGGGTPPWEDPQLVACEELTEHDYTADGPEAILDPEWGEWEVQARL